MKAAKRKIEDVELVDYEWLAKIERTEVFEILKESFIEGGEFFSLDYLRDESINLLYSYRNLESCFIREIGYLQYDLNRKVNELMLKNKSLRDRLKKCGEDDLEQKLFEHKKGFFDFVKVKKELCLGHGAKQKQFPEEVCQMHIRQNPTSIKSNSKIKLSKINDEYTKPLQRKDYYRFRILFESLQKEDGIAVCVEYNRLQKKVSNLKNGILNLKLQHEKDKQELSVPYVKRQFMLQLENSILFHIMEESNKNLKLKEFVVEEKYVDLQQEKEVAKLQSKQVTSTSKPSTEFNIHDFNFFMLNNEEVCLCR